MVEARQRARLQRRQDRAASQHGTDPHVESVALDALHWYPNAFAIGPARLRAGVVDANHHLLRPLLVLGLSHFDAFFEAAPIERAAARSQPRSWVGFSQPDPPS